MSWQAIKSSRLSRLSLDAIRSGGDCRARDISAVFEHLYTYNSVSSTEAPDCILSGADSVRRELGLTPDGPLRPILAGHWVQLAEEAADGWLTWIRPNRYERLSGSASSVVFKLYLSPSLEALPQAAQALIETLTFASATSFKIGTRAADLLRPDKMIAYFSTQADLAQTARQLADRLIGVLPQGVPFTAEIAGDGLLSWGVDPPARARALGQSVHSWREWVCYQLAIGIAEAEEASEAGSPAEQTLARLRSRGVDTERWLPPVAAWGRALR